MDISEFKHVLYVQVFIHVNARVLVCVCVCAACCTVCVYMWVAKIPALCVCMWFTVACGGVSKLLMCEQNVNYVTII